MIETGDAEGAESSRQECIIIEGSTLKKLMIFAIGAYTVLTFVSLVYAQASAGKLTAKLCSSCHDTSRVCDRLGKRTPEVWQQTVERMRGNGAQFSDADAATVAEYLATAKPGSKYLCNK